MLDVGKLCITFDIYNTRWEDKLEGHIIVRRANLCPK